MMKKINVMMGMLLMMGAWSSCQSDKNDGAEGYGYIQLSDVDVNKEVEISRATAGEQLALDILDSEGIVRKHADDWNELKAEPVLLPAGKEYTVKAYSFGKEADTQGFDATPYYAGETKKLVVANRSETVEVTCRLAQAMVSVAYTENFKKAFGGDVSCTLTDGKETPELNVVFAPAETRPAYVKANQPLKVALALPGGKTFSKQFVEIAKAAYHYKLTFDMTDGKGDFNVSVDQSKHEYTVILKIPTTSPDLQTENIANNVSKVWGQFAYLSGTCKLEGAVSFKYKKKGEGTEWTTVAAEKAATGENAYQAKAAPLELNTEYEYYIACGAQTGETCSFKTEALDASLTNLGFETWTQKGKNWYPNADASNSYWATGNEGVTMVLVGGNANSIPVEDGRTGKAAKLETIGVKFAGFAAGNLFVGNYKTEMSAPATSVKFGRSYSGARPVKLSGWYKYTPGPTMNGGKVPSDRTLAVDECDIYIKLWAGEEVIAEAHHITNETVSEYKKFELSINYKDESKRPDKITIVATSSRYGGEFEGLKVVGQLAVGSTLWVDDFELSYY